MANRMDEDPVMDGEDETEDEAPASSNVGPALTDMAGRYGITAARSAYDTLSANTRKAREALQGARERILARQFDRSQALLALAAGLGAPTRSGGFGETLGNVAQALQDPVREKRKFETERERDVLGIDSAMLGLDEKSADAAFKLAELEAKMMPKATRKFSHVVLPNGELILTSDDGTVKRTGVKGPKPTEARTLTKGEEALDRKFADEYVAWITGGAADSMKSRAELEAAKRQLTSNDDWLSGPIVGLVPKFARDFVLPKSAAVQEDIEVTVQRSLRPILGPQFTEKEGERLISRVYNPRLEEEQNARRLFRLLRQIELAYDNKQRAAEYFEEHGTMKGFKGKINYMLADFDPDVADELAKAEEAAALQEQDETEADDESGDEADDTQGDHPMLPKPKPDDLAPATIGRLTSKAQVDALPKGAYYYWKNEAKTRRKAQ